MVECPNAVAGGNGGLVPSSGSSSRLTRPCCHCLGERILWNPPIQCPCASHEQFAKHSERKSLPFQSPFEEVEEENLTARTWTRCWGIPLCGPISDPSGTWTNLLEMFPPPLLRFSGAHWPPRALSWAARSSPLRFSSGLLRSRPPPSATSALDVIRAPGNYTETIFKCYLLRSSLM